MLSWYGYKHSSEESVAVLRSVVVVAHDGNTGSCKPACRSLFQRKTFCEC